MDNDKLPSYVHKVSDMMLIDSKEEYYPQNDVSKTSTVSYKKLVVPSSMRSIYWKCYGFPATEDNEILTRNKIVCLLCRSQMVYNRNTSNLRMHLQNKHKAELETLELVQPLPSCKSGRTDQRSARRGTKLKKKDYHQEGLQVVAVHSQDESLNDSSTFQHFLAEGDEITPLQAIVKEVTTSQSYTLDDGKLIADAVSEFIIMDLQSPDIVEGKGFQRLIATLKSPCEIPSKNRLTDEFLPKIHDCVKDQLLVDLQSLNCEMSLSIDDWESASGDTYSTVSIHYATLEEGEMQTKILSNIFCSDLEPLHWGVQFDGVAEEWGLSPGKVRAVIVASDRLEVFDSLVARHYVVIPCLAHTLQTSLMDTCFKKAEVTKVIKKCRNLIAVVHSLPSVATFLRENESLMEIERGGLQVDTPPLWSSSFTMLEQLLVRKELLPSLYNSIASAGPSPDPFRFDSSEWALINDITDVLSPFKVAMSSLYEERIPLVSFLKPLMQQLKNVHLEKHSYDSKFTLELKANLSAFITGKYNDPRISEILEMSCILDPRFKSLPFLAEDYKARIKGKLKAHLENVAEISELGNENKDPPNKKQRLSGMEYLLGDLCVKNNEMPASQRTNLEIVQYECEPPIGLEQSPIEFWKENQSKYPKLSRVALRFLSIPVCVNNFLNSHYNSKTTNLNLTPQLAHRLRFLHQNNR